MINYDLELHNASWALVRSKDRVQNDTSAIFKGYLSAFYDLA